MLQHFSITRDKSCYILVEQKVVKALLLGMVIKHQVVRLFKA